MTKASDLAARAARLSVRPATSRASGSDAEDTGESEIPSKPLQRAAPRAKPVRVTTDLAPQSYRALLAYCAALAEDLGRAKVPNVEVIRALVNELSTDPKLQATIGQAVRAQLSK